MNACRSCGRPVRFVESAVSGRVMILDGEPSDKGNVTIDENGQARVVSTPLDGSARYLSHFATCPDAKRFRRRDA